MTQKKAICYGAAIVGAITAFILVRRYIGRKKIEALKKQHLQPETVATAPTNL